MGTNYYGRKIPTKEELKTISEAVLKGDLKAAKEMINKSDLIHIGKSSAGWDFLFNLNGQQYYHDKPSLIKWLQSVEITNEYGTRVSFHEFWNEIANNRTWNGHPCLKHTASKHAHEYIVIDGLEFLDCEFC